jgi:hypothetical protein
MCIFIFVVSTELDKRSRSSHEIGAEPERWLQFLPRWSLIVGLATLTLPILFVGGVGQQASDEALGAAYVELLQGAGFLLVAWSVFSLRGFPRWLAIWLVLPGMLAIAQFFRFVAGAEHLFVLNLIGLTVGNIALNLAMSVALWRPSIPLLASVAGKDVEG